MPKLGLKYFIGSFLLSLVAVFVAMKAYIVVSMHEEKDNNFVVAENEARNIELFAANEENDPLYEKFKNLENKQKPLLNSQVTQQNETSETDFEPQEDTVLYTPEEDAEPEKMVVANNDNSKTDNYYEDSDDKDVNSIIVSAPESQNEELISETDNELKIADASIEENFAIPLVHNFKIAGKNVKISDQADNNQIAMAPHTVNVNNLGAEEEKAVTEPLTDEEEVVVQDYEEYLPATESTELVADVASPKIATDDPWKTAETSNKYASKNSIDAYASQQTSEATYPQQNVTEQTQDVEEPESQEVATVSDENNTVPYKMQQNILIPIPENIMREGNLTPQFSSSKENLQLEEELRARKQLPPLNENQAINTTSENISVTNEDEDKDFGEDEETSKNLTDSIAEWFSGKKENSKKDTNSQSKDNENDKKEQKNSSIFNKLLGIGSNEEEDNAEILPTELKLFFQPNRAEISGQTLEWLHAFSDNTVKNENVIIEIRISNTAPYDLQEKRLKLLYKILANNGVNYNKINIIFTDREPNSFIIRNVRYATEEEIRQAQQKAQEEAKLAARKKADNPWF